jgi:hypothetical protein
MHSTVRYDIMLAIELNPPAPVLAVLSRGGRWRHF